MTRRQVRPLALVVTVFALLATSSAQAAAPTGHSHPVRATAFCAGGEKVHGKVAPWQSPKGSWFVSSDFWITGATPFSTWGVATEVTSTRDDLSTGGTSDGVATADENGRVDLGGMLASGLHSRNSFRVIAQEQGPDTPVTPASTCLLVMKVHY